MKNIPKNVVNLCYEKSFVESYTPIRKVNCELDRETSKAFVLPNQLKAMQSILILRKHRLVMYSMILIRLLVSLQFRKSHKSSNIFSCCRNNFNATFTASWTCNLVLTVSGGYKRTSLTACKLTL
jgi:hypothetical protein